MILPQTTSLVLHDAGEKYLEISSASGAFFKVNLLDEKLRYISEQYIIKSVMDKDIHDNKLIKINNDLFTVDF